MRTRPTISKQCRYARDKKYNGRDKKTLSPTDTFLLAQVLSAKRFQQSVFDKTFLKSFVNAFPKRVFRKKVSNKLFMFFVLLFWLLSHRSMPFLFTPPKVDTHKHPDMAYPEIAPDIPCESLLGLNPRRALDGTILLNMQAKQNTLVCS